jgi:glycosyltransferase involved in cell wall biosynthesis
LRELAAWANAPGGIPEACINQGYLLYGRVLERSNAVIVHSRWCAEQIENRFPAHGGKSSVVEYGATALNPSPERRRAIRDRLGLPEGALIIAGLEPLQASKMNCETIAAFASLAQATPEALLIFAGHELDNGEARRKVNDLGLSRRVRFLGHKSADVNTELASIADIGVCLRRPPTSGETPGALMDLLRVGVPTIVTDVASFSCLPDSVVRKHRWDLDGLAGLTRVLRELARDRRSREAIGRAAWHYIHQNHSWQRAADSYEEIIERTVAGRHRHRVERPSALSDPRIVSPEWLHAAS